MMNKVFFGDCRDVMRQLTSDGVKVQTCITSPPYWNLRDYGHPGQIGLEKTIDEYLANLVEVFACVWDLLADDGTLWVNMGDSYAGSWGNYGGQNRGNGSQREITTGSKIKNKAHENLKDFKPAGASGSGLPAKNLIGMPWRLAFALQDHGWILRQDIIWSKPNPMPESIKDRFTKAHEYIFLFSKQPRYYFDQEAVKEPAGKNTHARRSKYKTPDGWDTSKGEGGHGGFHKKGREKGRKLETPGKRVKNNTSFDEAMAVMPDNRNKRSVWTVATQPYSGAHFATFPPALIEPCILAGSKPGDIVLDPFFGSGTTGQVSQKLGRQWIGIDINEDYSDLQKKRTEQLGLELA